MKTWGLLALLAWPTSALIPSRVPHGPRVQVKVAASSLLEANKDYESEGKPRWAGGGFISDLTSDLIASPLFKFIKLGARNLIINGAVNKGIQWKERRDELASKQSTLEKFYRDVEDKSLVYPSYYTQVDYLKTNGLH